MRTILYRRWAPAKSAVKVEFPPDIIHDIRAQSPAAHDRGYLFGWHDGSEVRITTAIRTPEADDPRTAGTEPVGVYITRARGEVFLTDADLEQVDRLPGGIALVIAGGRAGFFARDADGSMQAVRSHEEFLVADAATQPLARPPRERHAPPPVYRKWAIGLAGLLIGPIAALAYLHPLGQHPLDVSLRETNGQLVMQWDPEATTTDAFLEITEAEGRTVLQVPPDSSSATYAPRSGDVEVLLSTPTRSGRVHWTSARFVPAQETPRTTAFRTPEQIQEDMDELQSQASYLRQAIARRKTKVAQLSAEADRILGPVQ